MLAVDVSDPTELSAFIGSVLDRFMVFRTALPPGRYAILVTIIGSCSADEFAAEWRRRSLSDEVLSAYMNDLLAADVLLGTSDGQVLEVASCLPE